MKKILLLGTILATMLGTNLVMAHEHKPPHKGTLVVLGEEFSHLEFVLDSEKGQLTAYALDGEAENAERIPQKSIDLKITLDKGQPQQRELNLTLNAVENVLTGESVGDTSEFMAQSDDLKSRNKFFATIANVTIKGQEFKNVDFDFPEGNDHDEK